MTDLDASSRYYYPTTAGIVMCPLEEQCKGHDYILDACLVWARIQRYVCFASDKVSRYLNLGFQTKSMFVY